MSFLNPQSQDYLPREVANHKRMGLRQHLVSGTLGTLAIDTSPENTWISVGPTGSGADLEWAAMDVIPPNSSAIIIRCDSQIDGPGGGTKAQAFVFARQNGSSAGNTRQTTVSQAIYDNTTGGQGDEETISENVVPLDGSNLFQIRWNSNNETDFDIDIEYVGFICEQIDPLEAPVVLSVDNWVSVCNPSGAGGWKDCVTLNTNEIDEAAVESLYTHYHSTAGPGDSSPPAFPGAGWVAYTGVGGDDSITWDTFGSENGPLNQPTAAGPYTGAGPWNDAENFSVIDAGGGGNWFRMEVTISNSEGSDTFEVFYQGDCF